MINQFVYEITRPKRSQMIIVYPFRFLVHEFFKRNKQYNLF